MEFEGFVFCQENARFAEVMFECVVMRVCPCVSLSDLLE